MNYKMRYYTEIPIMAKLHWWEEILLRFLQTHSSVHWNGKEHIVETFKLFRNRRYLIKRTTLEQLQRELNDYYSARLLHKKL